METSALAAVAASLSTALQLESFSHSICAGPCSAR